MTTRCDVLLALDDIHDLPLKKSCTATRLQEELTSRVLTAMMDEALDE